MCDGAGCCRPCWHGGSGTLEAGHVWWAPRYTPPPRYSWTPSAGPGSAAACAAGNTCAKIPARCVASMALLTHITTSFNITSQLWRNEHYLCGLYPVLYVCCSTQRWTRILIHLLYIWNTKYIHSSPATALSWSGSQWIQSQYQEYLGNTPWIHTLVDYVYMHVKFRLRSLFACSHSPNTMFNCTEASEYSCIQGCCKFAEWHMRFSFPNIISREIQDAEIRYLQFLPDWAPSIHE